ncbi:energy transducer TonB [Erythrobacter sp. NE805]|uniref:energy transducer TonB n=1 Tax=Erythrobacter sp. NE805 TaxID=3389875 RepID=UPI00396B3B77
MKRIALVLAGFWLAAPVTAFAQSDPVPLAPETWQWKPRLCYHEQGCYDEGSVRVALTISPEGRVTGCTIVASSGKPRLDEDSCRLMTIAARFTPARGSRGRAVRGRYETSVHWKVPETDVRAGGS